MKKAMVFGAGVSGLGAEHLLENMGYEVYLLMIKKEYLLKMEWSIWTK